MLRIFFVALLLGSTCLQAQQSSVYYPHGHLHKLSLTAKINISGNGKMHQLKFLEAYQDKYLVAAEQIGDQQRIGLYTENATPPKEVKNNQITIKVGGPITALEVVDDQIILLQAHRINLLSLRDGDLKVLGRKALDQNCTYTDVALIDNAIYCVGKTAQESKSTNIEDALAQAAQNMKNPSETEAKAKQVIQLSIVPISEGRFTQVLLSEGEDYRNPQILNRNGQLAYVYDKGSKSYAELLDTRTLLIKQKKEVLKKVYASEADAFTIQKARLDDQGRVVVSFRGISRYERTEKGDEMQTVRLGFLRFNFETENYKGYYISNIDTSLWARSPRFHPGIQRYHKHLIAPRTGSKFYFSSYSKDVPYKILPNGDLMLFYKFTYDRMHFRTTSPTSSLLTEYEKYSTDHSCYIVFDQKSLRPKYFDIIDTVNENDTNNSWDNSKNYRINDGILFKNTLMIFNGEHQYSRPKGGCSILMTSMNQT